MSVDVQDAVPAGAQAKASRIEISSVGKRYGDLQVFQDINLEFNEREIVTVVGPSGCGKTTLLRCIDGLLPATEGEIRIEGELMTQPREGVAMVFQHFGLFPWKTVAQNVGYGLKLAGTAKSEIDKKVPEFINMVGLTGFEDAYPYQLSGGMQQRCGLARALAMEPSVLLMDEPFAAVDAQTREILQFELLKIWGMRPMTMIFVTHSIEEAVLMDHRVVVLKGRPSSVVDGMRVEETSPGSHYAVFVSNKKVIAERRDALVRMAAAHIEAMNMIYDESKWDRIAEIANHNGRTPEDAKIALKIFTDMGYWPRNHAGLDEKRINKAIAIQTGVGKRTKGKAGINPEKTPVTHAELTDPSIVADALKLIEATN